MTLLRLLGGSDPKTIYKYLWPFIESLSELDYFAGYRGSAPEFVKCSGGVWGESAKHERQVRLRQETVNERLKNWGILMTPYRHDLRKHQTVFAAVITLLQLSLEHNPLFSVEYND